MGVRRVLITGGAGFIGSHLTEALLHEGDEVYIIDDFSTGSIDNIRHLQEDPRFSNRLFVRRGTILDETLLLEFIGTCDLVIHLAAAVGVKYIIDNPLSAIVTNVRGTELVLEYCAKFKKKVLLASTSEVYGKHSHAPLVETDDCIYGCSEKSRWSYAAGKLMDEFTGIAYYKTKGLPVIIVRLFNTVGPRQTGRYGMVMPRFVKQALDSSPITVFGDGTQTRTFTHVREVVRAITELIDVAKALGQVINIGGQEEISILDLAEKVKQATQSSSPIKLIPYAEAYPQDFEDMARRVPSTDKLFSLTGYRPTLGVDQILADTILHMERERSEALSGKYAGTASYHAPPPPSAYT